MDERRRFRVTGRVQGVGFRWWVLRHAQELRLRGTVRNHADGSVIVEASGSMDALESLRRLLDEGPPAAIVESVDELSSGDGALPGGFEIGR